MRFGDKLFLTHFITLVNHYHMIYKVDYAINQEGELSVIASIQYNGIGHVFFIEIIGSKK